jgi:restriction system protein
VALADKLPGPRNVRYYGAVLDALRALGGSGSPNEVIEKVVELLGISDEERDRWHGSGVRVVDSDIRWARNGLRMAGLLDGSEHGVWRLTTKGQETSLTHDQAHELVKENRVKRRMVKRQLQEQIVEALDAEEYTEEKSLLEVMRELPADGFERLCQRILRESGFVEVTVTGRSGDGGIDGNGILKVNELVSFHVLFQCKRYGDGSSVTPKQLRDFRGAMSGRTDKGIFLTTGTFTRDAVAEATRDGVPPIELVDGERLTALMEELKLGVKPRTVFDVDFDFFEPYR